MSKTIAQNDSRKVSIMGKQKESSRLDSPGPGHYEVNNIEMTKDKSRSVIISSKSQRTEIVSKQQKE